MGRKKGRPSLFTEEMLPLVRQLKSDGLTDFEIAKYLGINYSTLTHWKVENLAFRIAISRSDAEINKSVEKALYKRAIGMTVPVTKVSHHVVKVGEDIEQITMKTKTQQHIAPDVAAQKEWLSKRDKDRWGDNKREENEIDNIAKEEASVAALLGLVRGTTKDER